MGKNCPCLSQQHSADGTAIAVEFQPRVGGCTAVPSPPSTQKLVVPLARLGGCMLPCLLLSTFPKIEKMAPFGPSRLASPNETQIRPIGSCFPFMTIGDLWVTRAPRTRRRNRILRANFKNRDHCAHRVLPTKEYVANAGLVHLRVLPGGCSPR